MPQCYQSITIPASISDTWNAIRDFHDMSWSSRAITNCEKIGEQKGTQPGAKRILNGVFHETLLEVDDSNHVIRYSIDEGVSPVSSKDVKNYVGVIRLRPSTVDNGTFVEWSSSWESASNDAVEFCHGIYVALLKEMKEAVGKG